MSEPKKRAGEIISEICNRRRNSDIRADDREISARFDEEFAERDVVVARLYKRITELNMESAERAQKIRDAVPEHMKLWAPLDAVRVLAEEHAEMCRDTQRIDRLENKVARREVADMLREDPFSSLREHIDRTLRILDHESEARP